MTVLFGGTFDPPHLGHVAIADAARERFGAERLVLLVAEHPEHRSVSTPAPIRLELARAAFPDDDVRLDPYPRTVDLLRAERFHDSVFVVGADEFSDFLGWKEPDEVLALTRLAVGTRPGFPHDRLERVLARVAHPERVVFFELAPDPRAATDVRARAAAGDSLDGLVPPAVASLIRERGLYRGS